MPWTINNKALQVSDKPFWMILSHIWIRMENGGIPDGSRMDSIRFPSVFHPVTNVAGNHAKPFVRNLQSAALDRQWDEL